MSGESKRIPKLGYKQMLCIVLIAVVLTDYVCRSVNVQRDLKIKKALFFFFFSFQSLKI